MKKYSLEKFKENKKNKKMAKLTIIILVSILLLIIVALYMANRSFRSFIDTYILRKEISESTANTITIDTENLSLIYAYDKNLAVYIDGNINFYNSSAKQSGNVEITLSKPIAASSKNYLILGDYGSQKICLIKDNELVWQKDVEGKVSKISVNKNGYTAVSVTGTTYESIVLLYNPKGELLFKNYLSTSVLATDISEDNEYIAIAQTDNSKIAPSTKIEIISITQAAKDSENALVNTYQAENSEFLSGMNFQDKGNLICCFDEYILRLNDVTNEKIYELSDATAYIDVNMSSNFARIDKETSSVFRSDYRLKISDINKKEKVYIIEGNLAGLKVKENKIAINLGNEVQFINQNGWLKKRFVSEQAIKDFVVSDKIGAVIYKSKIAVIEL